MPGFDIKRFIDLNESVAKHLICSICLNIYNNAVITLNECEHSFCKDCVQQWITTNHKECPECRTMFATRKRSNAIKNDNNLVIIKNYIFKRNLLINNMINEMKIKCDFDFNGCQHSVKLSQLSAHIKECEHRFCDNCGFTFGKTEEHNCFELMKNNRNELKLNYENQIKIINKLKEENETKIQTNEKTINELKESFEKSLEDMNQIKENNSKLKTELQSKETEVKKLNKQLSENKVSFKNEIKSIVQKTLEKIPDFCDSSLSFSPNSKEEILQYLSGLLLFAKNFCSSYFRIKFGNYGSYSGRAILEDNIIEFKSITTNTKVYQRVNINLSFNQLQEVMYSRENSIPIIYLKTTKQSCDLIAKTLGLDDNSPNGYRFDVNSNDSKYRFINIEFKANDQELYFDCFLRYIKLREPGIKIQETKVITKALNFNYVNYFTGI